jgi:hypothetical protein
MCSFLQGCIFVDPPKNKYIWTKKNLTFYGKNLTYAPNDDKKEAQIEHHIKDGVQFKDLTTGPLVKGGVHSHLQTKIFK